MDQTKPLSASAFERLVQHLSAEQIRHFPRAMLPDPIPLEVLERVSDPARRDALETLAWHRSADSLAASQAARGTLDGSVCDALECAESNPAPGIGELERLTTILLQKWQGTDAPDDWLDGSQQKLEQARRLASTLTEEVGRLAQAVDVLDRPFVGDDALGQRISAARSQAKKRLTRMQSVLGRYYLLELDVAHGDMKDRHWQCETCFARLREFDQQIRTVQGKLERQNRFGARLLRPAMARRQRELLMERLQTLTQKRDSLETPISEDDLLHWLDVLTDASLLVAEEEWRNKAQRTRLLLYRLLNLYCLQQETSAQQVAGDPRSRVNAREAIDYYLSSERFILRYFSRKRQQVTLWLAGAARDKLGTLDRIRDAILSDYRRMVRLSADQESTLSGARDVTQAGAH